MASVRVEIGQVIAGKYRHEGVIGEGPMSVVIAAHGLAIEQPVRIKLFRADVLARLPDATASFRAEVRAAAKLSSSFGVRVFGSGDLPDMGPFVVYEATDAVDLRRALDDCGTFDIEESVELAMQACEALAEAHMHGLAHLGVRPRNLLVGIKAGKHVLRVVDFGASAARLAGHRIADLDLDETAVVQTLRYMAPEQLREGPVDSRADVWAIGAVLYEMLSGKPAFPAETAARVRDAVLGTTPFPLVRFRPEVPEELAIVVGRCLAKDPVARFGDVAELAMALIAFGPRTAIESARRSSRYLEQELVDEDFRDPELARSTTPYLPSADDSNEFAPIPPDAPMAQEEVASPRSHRGRRSLAIAVGVVVLAALVATLRAIGGGTGGPVAALPTAAQPAETASAAPPPLAPIATPTVASSATPSAASLEPSATPRAPAPLASATIARPPPTTSAVAPRTEPRPRRRPDLGY